MPGVSGVTVVTNSCVFHFYARGCGCDERPVFPAPSPNEGHCPLIARALFAPRECWRTSGIGCLKTESENYPAPRHTQGRIAQKCMRVRPWDYQAGLAGPTSKGRRPWLRAI
jgi:hypothetical protein